MDTLYQDMVIVSNLFIEHQFVKFSSFFMEHQCQNRAWGYQA